MATKPDSEKNPAAVALGRLGAKKLTHAQRSKGGKARAAKLSPRRRKQIAKIAVAAREKKRAELKNSESDKSNRV